MSRLHRRNGFGPRVVCLLVGAIFATSAFAFNVVVLDPGHGGADQGTRWYGVSEKTLTLDVAKRVETILRDEGIKTVMTRRSDKTVSLDARASTANRLPRSLLVSIHFNASRKTSISGYETFYRSEKGKRVAQSIQKSLGKVVPSKSRGVTNNNLAVLTRTKGVAVLVECGFISNKAEATRCSSPAFRQKLARAIASGIQRAM